MFGGLLTVAIVGILFFYVYDTQIRIVMNTTERAEIISLSSEEEPQILTFSESEGEIVQIVTCEEKTLTGLGVMMSVPESAVSAGTLSARVTDLNSGEVLSENVLDMASAIDGEYINFLFTHEVNDGVAHSFEIRLTPSEELKTTPSKDLLMNWV